MNRQRKYATPQSDSGYYNTDGTLKHYSEVKVHRATRQIVQSSPKTEDVLGFGAGALGAAATFAPVLAPAAAAAGVGYGVYKLGQSFSLW